jgi:hypothetical protein
MGVESYVAVWWWWFWGEGRFFVHEMLLPTDNVGFGAGDW